MCVKPVRQWDGRGHRELHRACEGNPLAVWLAPCQPSANYTTDDQVLADRSGAQGRLPSGPGTPLPTPSASAFWAPCRSRCAVAAE